MLFGKKKRRIEHVLVVEDEPLVAFDTEYFLSDEGFAIVATVDRVADALAVIEDAERALDLIVLDISLADGSGIDVARAAQARGVKVLFVTGDCPDEARAVAIGWLSKPYSQRDLLHSIDIIDAMIDGTRPKRLPPGFSLFDPIA